MSRKHTPRAAFSLFVAVALALPITASPAAAKDEALLRIRAWAVDLNSGARTSTIDIVIERWSTPEEIESLRGILIEKGGDKLLPALQKIKPRCGFTRTSNSLGWDLHFARETQMSDGTRKIVVATDRPISFWEARNNPRSRDYEFSLAEIRLGANGKGQGKAITMAKLSFNKETSTLEIENYQREPVRLNEVTIVR
ncbi:MAG: hypothetical protein A2V74_10140 [Acidobacteria bacterium RBG_16_70_10]|nr:MAG: hypothetical protein A2V74_10140 [Acidobacteria bacterium RBG_16_70_10]